MKKEVLTPHAEALALVLKNVRVVGVEKVALLDSVGRALRRPIRSDRPLPPFNRSAMDGYAARFSDFVGGKALLRCVGALEAGRGWKGSVKRGETVKIMTGAPVPDLCDVVVKVERSKRSGDMVALEEPGIKRWENIHRMGADAKRGQTLVEEGTVLNPLHLSVAASVGATAPLVSRLVRVCVISTGDELVSARKKPGPFQIRDANSSFLLSRLGLVGSARAKFGGMIPDDPDALAKAAKPAIDGNDLVIISGGVSMGDSDHTSKVLERLGVRKVFHKCAIRPGKPVWFGVKGGTAVFGLPGNPVSIAVTFHEFVLPAVRKMTGVGDPFPRRLFPPLGAEVKKNISLREFRVARMTGAGRVEAVKGYGGSGDFVSASKSVGVIVMPEESRKIGVGAAVEFHPWEF